MSQRPITAFFSKPRLEKSSPTQSIAPKENSVKKSDNSVEATVPKASSILDSDSPIKKVKSTKKRVKILDSDDDSQDSDHKKIKCDLNSSSESCEDKNKNSISVVKTPEKAKKSPTPKGGSKKSGKKKSLESSKKKIETSESLKKESSPKAKSGTKAEDTDNSKVTKKDSSPKAKTVVKVEDNDKEKSGATKQETSPKAKTEANGKGDKLAVPVEISKYNPLKSDYQPIKDAGWEKGKRVPYMALARTLELIEETSSRLKMIEILANYFRSVILLSPDDLLFSVYLCLNQLAPAYVGLELGVGEGIIIKALAQATGRAPDKVKADAAAKGDLGLVAELSKGTQRTLSMFKPTSLTVRSVFDGLTEIASMSGNSSQSKKVDKIHGLIVASKQLEARYLTRSLAGKLRIGIAEQSLLQALALATTMTPPNQPDPPEVLNSCKGLSEESKKAKVEENAILIKTAYCQCPSYDRLVSVLLRQGVSSLPELCTLTPGVPLKPMLACPSRGIQEVLQKFDSAKFTCEWKYDGERAQIHLMENGDIRIYSRNQENNTSKYPDLIKRFNSWIKPDKTLTTAILDTEAVAWDTEKKQILPFQVLSTRKRKDAVESEIKVQVCVFAFDLLFINGESLVQKPLTERREKLWEFFQPVDGQFGFATSKDPETLEEVEEFLESSLKGNCEGLMVKALDVNATYEIAKRSKNWVKLKKDYLEGIGDTIDAVVIGGYLGKGKRTGLYGGFLLACYDESNEEYQSLCKIGTGFSDEDFQKHSDFLKNHVIPKPKPYYQYDQGHTPDHWFEPVQVWEIKCADLSISPAHKAAVGIVDPNKGISLRFPRFLRIRDDKGPENATSAEQIAELYGNQEQVKNRKVDEEEEFY